MSVSASGAPPLRPRLNVAGGTCNSGELGQVSELKFVRAHVGDPTVLEVGGRGALMYGHLHDGVALRDAPAATTLASLVVLRTVKYPIYLIVKMSAFDMIPDVRSASGAGTPGWGCRPLLLRQWNT